MAKTGRPLSSLATELVDLSAGARERPRARAQGSGDGARDRRGHQGRGVAPRGPRPSAGALLGHRAAAAHHARRTRQRRDRGVGRGDCRQRQDELAEPGRDQSCLSTSTRSPPSATHAAGRCRRSSTAAERVPCRLARHGITVHPRADARHITFQDVHDLTAMLAPQRKRVEFNIEGDPRPDLLALVRDVRPDQCTLVPVAPGRSRARPAGRRRRRRRRDARASWRICSRTASA